MKISFNARFINYYINSPCNHFNRICFIILNGVDNMMDKILIINKFRYIAWCKVTAQLKKSIILASACTQRKNILCACQLILPQSSNESRINPLTQFYFTHCNFLVVYIFSNSSEEYFSILWLCLCNHLVVTLKSSDLHVCLYDCPQSISYILFSNPVQKKTCR